MGFLKFLKRDKGKEPDLDLENMEDLDMPPVPPDFEKKDLGDVKGELPELPKLPEIGVKEPFSPMKEKPIPDLDLLPEEPIPELELPKEKPVSEFELPPLPGPKLEEDIIPKEAPKIPPLSKPLFGMPKPIFGVQKPAEQEPKVEVPEIPRLKPEIRPYERLERAAIREERAVLTHKEAEGPIYIKIDRFRGILTGTKTIKNNLKTASQSIVKLNEIDINRDKVFEKWHNVLMDLQKKLIFIDKILFKKI
ncbi:MAG: hypothetical protein IH934_07065 [Nanoarchaeota archaeon]|nr:hypothetical protein [Nanoarchaeota archaeon]